MIRLTWHKGLIALFHIDGKKLGEDRLLVVREGDWTTPGSAESIKTYRIPGKILFGKLAIPTQTICSSHAEIQASLGIGLKCVWTEFSFALKSTMFLYEKMEKYATLDEYVLAVPATGEEIYFQLYRMNSHNTLTLLIDREL